MILNRKNALIRQVTRSLEDLLTISAVMNVLGRRCSLSATTHGTHDIVIIIELLARGPFRINWGREWAILCLDNGARTERNRPPILDSY